MPPNREMEVVIPEANIRLPNIQHHFSTIVCLEGVATEEYYELSPKFHGRYRSSDLFRALWYTWTRVIRTAEKAVKLRTKRVLLRAKVTIRSFNYFAVVYIQDEGGQTRSMRHVSLVTVSEKDLDRLLKEECIRPFSAERATGHPLERVRAVVHCLTPVAAQIAA